MQLHYRVVQRVTIAFEGEDLELVEQACRELAERARREAEAVKGTSIEPIHNSTEARFLGMAERLKIARG
jgi:dihydroneopterin aldolase